MKRSRPLLTVAVLSAVSLATLPSLPVQAERIQVQAAPAAQASAYALVGTIPMPLAPPISVPTVNVLAITQDDTVYAPATGANYVGILSPGRISGTIDDSLVLTDQATAAAVSRDDTLYVLQGSGGVAPEIRTYRPDLTFDDSVSINNDIQQLALSRDDTLAAVGQIAQMSFLFGNSLVLSSTATASGRTYGSGAFDSQGRFYIGVLGNDLVAVGASGLTVDDTIPLGGRALSVIINADDTKYVANYDTAHVQVISSTGQAVAYAVPVGALPGAVGFTPAGDVLVVNHGPRSLSLIGRNALTSDTIITGLSGEPRGLAIASTGIVYVSIATYVIDVAAPVSASLSTVVAPAGSSLGVELTGLPAASVADDSTFVDVWWGDDTVAFTRNQGRNSVSLTVPPGSGTVPVVVQLRGGNAVTAGTFTYGSPTPPAPLPATPPQDVTALPGDGSASVSWLPPASSGSFAVSTYQAVAAPGGRTCLVSAPSLSCDVSGLSNGTSYTFTVRALTGAGWSASSELSNAVTPEAPTKPTIVITGSREGKRIEITGVTTGFGMGAVLRPWFRFPGQSGYSEGSAMILVSVDDTFEWGRKTGKRVSVYVQTPDGSVRSNAVTIQLR